MAQITLRKSFASNEQYAQIQGRIYHIDMAADTAILHLQGRGPEGNRDYGFACNVTVTRQFAEWLEQQEHTLPSLAESDRIYVPIQVRLDDNTNTLRVQVRGSNLNREYGAACRISQEVHEIEPLVDWLRDNVGNGIAPTNDAVQWRCE